MQGSEGKDKSQMEVTSKFKNAWMCSNISLLPTKKTSSNYQMYFILVKLRLTEPTLVPYHHLKDNPVVIRWEKINWLF